MSQSSSIITYDTTLRDGAQREGISFSLDDKLRIAYQLDQLGISFIEGGWPGANPKDVEFFWKLKEKPLTKSKIVAFCSTRRPRINAAEDPILQNLLAAQTQWVTIFGKSWDLQVTDALKTSLDENLAMIDDTIKYLKSEGCRIIYDAEHWFDGFKHNPTYALQTLIVAIKAGAEWIVLCDTNGGTLPFEVTEIVSIVAKTINCSSQNSGTLTNSANVRIGIHAHNDCESAVANSIAAVMEGAEMIQGTINGYGERCGNANLCSLIPNLQLKLGYTCIEHNNLSKITQTSRFVNEIANLIPNEHSPFVGLSAFAHKGGVHISAVKRNPRCYEHIQPELVGNYQRFVISEQSGLSSIIEKAANFGINLNKDDLVCHQILKRVKNLECEGYQFEMAEASFEMLVREAVGQSSTLFDLKDFHVICDHPQEQKEIDSTSIATVKLAIDKQDILEVADGDGPVSAIYAAMQKAIMSFYPEVKTIRLVDYKVRILKDVKVVSPKNRVLVEFNSGENHWSTIGVSRNIIIASCPAIKEGIEYGLLLYKHDSMRAVPVKMTV
jgi:2-isopropylmalate synthase